MTENPESFLIKLLIIFIVGLFSLTLVHSLLHPNKIWKELDYLDKIIFSVIVGFFGFLFTVTIQFLIEIVKTIATMQPLKTKFPFNLLWVVIMILYSTKILSWINKIKSKSKTDGLSILRYSNFSVLLIISLFFSIFGLLCINGVIESLITNGFKHNIFSIIVPISIIIISFYMSYVFIGVIVNKFLKKRLPLIPLRKEKAIKTKSFK